MLLPSSRSQSTRGRFTIDRRSISRFTQTCRLPPVGACVARRVTGVSIQLITDSLLSRPNTLRRMSLEAVTPPRFHTQLGGRPYISSSSDLESLVQLLANVFTHSAVTQETVRFNMDVVEHFSEHVVEHSNQNATHAEKQHHDDRFTSEPIHLRIHEDVLTTRSSRIHQYVFTTRSPSLLPLKARLPAANSMSMRERDSYFVARSAMLVSVGVFLQTQCFLRTFSCTQSHLASTVTPKPFRMA